MTTRSQTRLLAARFRAECEADLRYALAEGLDPEHEYLRLVEQLQHPPQPAETKVSAPVVTTEIDPPHVPSTPSADRRSCDAETQDLREKFRGPASEF